MQTHHPAFINFNRIVAKAVLPLAVSEQTMTALAKTAELRQLGKGRHLLSAGETVQHIFFVHAGLIRYYYIDETSHEERTGQFFDENDVYTDVASFFGGLPSHQYIQSLTSSEILCIPRAAIYAAFETDHALERFGRLMAEQGLIGSHRRTANMLTLDLHERYRLFVTSRPTIARRVPQYLIASYLGVTPEALSRMRRRETRLAASR